jgi:hypothetical protein
MGVTLWAASAMRRNWHGFDVLSSICHEEKLAWVWRYEQHLSWGETGMAVTLWAVTVMRRNCYRLT